MDELEQAIKLLRQMYDFGKKYHHVRNPIGYALYHTWKEFDKKEYEKGYEQQKLF